MKPTFSSDRSTARSQRPVSERWRAPFEALIPSIEALDWEALARPKRRRCRALSAMRRLCACLV